MGDKYEYPQANGIGTVTEDEASITLIPDTKNELYLYVERIGISVYRAAIGGGGILQIKESDGDAIIWTVNVDGIKDVSIDWGDEGAKASNNQGTGLIAVLSGADTQASVSIGITAHYNRE